jgi:hypothetical protein
MFYCEQARHERMNESAVATCDVSIEKNAAKKKRATLVVVT